MQTDVDRWERKYASRVADSAPAPDDVLLEHVRDGQGLALDLACGLGANTRYLGSIGYHCIGLDCSFSALRYARRLSPSPQVHFAVVDLDRFPLPQECFDLVVVTRYLNRRLIDSIKAAARPGGLVFYRTFNTRHLHGAPKFNPDFVLRAGELDRWFEDFETIATGGDDENQSYVLARRPMLSASQCPSTND